MRDPGVDVAKGIGILLVVGGHCDFFLITGINPYTFHMPLFFFIAGFFLNLEQNFISFLKKKSISLLLPYFIYNIIFCFITWGINNINIPWGSKELFDIFTFRNIFIEPFLTGQQYKIGTPLWFVPCLFSVFMLSFFVRKIYKNLKISKNKLYQIPILISLYYIFIQFPDVRENISAGIFARTAIGAIFCTLGSFYYSYIPKTYGFTKKLFITTFLLYTSICYIVGPVEYSSLWNNYLSGYAKSLSFLYSISGILMTISLANLICLNKTIFKSQLFTWLGKYSFHIMALHATGFFILNIIMASFLPNRYISSITKPFFSYSDNIMFLHFFFSIVWCIILITIGQKCKKMILSYFHAQGT